VLLKEDMPESVLSEAKRSLDGYDDIRIAVSSELDIDGKLSESWLLATDKRVMVLGRNCEGLSVLHDYELARLKEIGLDGQVGNGFLAALVDGHRVDLIRYSNAEARKFGAAAKQLEALSKGEEPKPDPEALPKRCPKCNFPLEPGSNVCANCVKRGQVILRLLTYAKPYRRTGMLVMFLLLSSSALDLVPAYLVRTLVNKVLVPHNGRLLPYLVLAQLGAGGLGVALSITQLRVGAWMGARIVHTVRMSLCQHLERLSVSYFDKRQTGAVMARVSQDTSELQGFLASDIYFFVNQICKLVGILTVMLAINWKVGLVALIPVPLTSLFTTRVMKGLRRVYRRLWHRRSRFGAILNDSLSGVRTVKAFAQEEREADRLKRRSGALMTAAAEAEATWGTLIPSLVFVMGSGSFIVWWYGGLQVVQRHMDLGSLMSILAYVGMLQGPLQIVVRLSDWMGRVLAAAERVFEVMDTPLEQPDAEQAVRMPDIQGHVDFRDVTFGYDQHNAVLHNMNLDVQPGEMIGLVGHSGAGKSTTINLICRFYSAQDGELLIDGVNIKEIKLSDLRSRIGIVPQEPYLFVGTIAENIAYSRPDASIEEIIRAAKAANAHEFVCNFPDGYETQVGERGQGLSGGEKQRIAIARAILHDPRILILDEATSSIDTETEQQIQEALARLVKNRTTFAIAHRLSTLRHADRLVVLEHGKIAEVGTHDELVDKKGTYYKLVEIQTELSRIKAVDG